MSTCAVLRHYNAAKQLKTILTLCTRTTGYTHTHGGCCENVTVNKCKKCRFIKTCKAIIDTYKTAKIPSVTSRAVDIIHSFIISTALDVTEGFFAVLYVSIMGLTRFYKTTVFYIYVCSFSTKC